MQRWTTWVVFVFFTCLVGNAMLIVISHLRDAMTFTESRSLLKKNVPIEDDCCSRLCKRDLNHTSNLVNYTVIANEMPKLDPAYHRLLVRLGSDLKSFDVNQCPSDSLMRDRHQDFTPMHLDCPTLFLVGARKGGTSSLYHYLSKHPDFEGTRMDGGPKVGETYYFSAFYNQKPWESYLSLFPPDGVMTGEASVGYLVKGETPKRLYKSCGKQAKVVMLLRDPIERLKSNFMMRARLQTARVTNETSISTIVRVHLDAFFQEVFKRTMKVKDLPAEWPKLVGLFEPSVNLVYEGLYYVHVMNWLCNFPAENILIINSEEFFRNSTKILDIVFQFLGLRTLDSTTYEWITSAVYNKGRYKHIPEYQTLSYSKKKSLLGVYKPFNRALLEFLQWNNKTHWE